MGEKNPFSIYDFLGYLFPGIVAIFVVFIWRQSILVPDCDFFDCLHVRTIYQLLQQELSLNWLQASVLVVVSAYIVGHLVAYASSLTIEFLNIKAIGYPSEYLLKDEGDEDSLWDRYWLLHVDEKSCNGDSKNKKGTKESRWKALIKAILKNPWTYPRRIVVCFLFFPITSVLFCLGKLFNLKEFLRAGLPKYMQEAVKAKADDLFPKLGLGSKGISKEDDFHRVVMHYVYLNIENAQRKADNYVALYGFLRAICFIATLFYDLIFVCALGSLKNFMEFNADGFIWTILIVGFFVCNLLFFEYVKFYRRFTLENFMALVAEKESIIEDAGSKS